MSEIPVLPCGVVKPSSWLEVVEAVDYFMEQGWVFRGQESADCPLRTSLEREFSNSRRDFEQKTLWHFVRLAPGLLPSHLVPDPVDAAAWLGLIQHYGGPTRLLDMTRSAYVALYFAFEASGDNDRAVWAVEQSWCMEACAQIMASNEDLEIGRAFERVAGMQAQLVYSLVHGQPVKHPVFQSFQPFSGVFPLDPWRPDARQGAQQAMFLCIANVESTFVANMAALSPTAKVLYKFVLPASLREEVLYRLKMMNVTAATLFPDLTGLARSLRTRFMPRWLNPTPPWERRGEPMIPSENRPEE